MDGKNRNSDTPLNGDHKELNQYDTDDANSARKHNFEVSLEDYNSSTNY